MSYMKFSDAALYHTALEARFDDLIQMECRLLHQTKSAFLIDTGNTDYRGKPEGVWIPKSMSRYKDGVLTISEKFATEKGLV